MEAVDPAGLTKRRGFTASSFIKAIELQARQKPWFIKGKKTRQELMNRSAEEL
jgi:hypothetical protein